MVHHVNMRHISDVIYISLVLATCTCMKVWTLKHCVCVCVWVCVGLSVCLCSAVTPVDVLMKNLNEMELKYKKQIKKHFTLLIQTTAVIGVVVVMFFVSSLVGGFELDLGNCDVVMGTGYINNIPAGWIALFGAITLIILSEQDVKGIFSRLELDTLLFFAALFIMMEV